MHFENLKSYNVWFNGLTDADKLIFRGSLDLSGLTSAEGLALPQYIGGSLYLSGLTSAEGLVLPPSIVGSLDLLDVATKGKVK